MLRFIPFHTLSRMVCSQITTNSVFASPLSPRDLIVEVTLIGMNFHFNLRTDSSIL